MAVSPFTGKEVASDNLFLELGGTVSYASETAAAMAPIEEKQEQYAAEVLQNAADKDQFVPEDLEMAARSFVDGLWFNKSEEIGSAVAAMAVKMLNPDIDQSFDQIRSQMLSNLEAESSRFAEENPWTAGLTNVAGGVLNPFSLAGGQMIAGAYRLKKGADAARASDEVAATLGGAFATRSDDAAALASQYGAQQAGRGAEALARSGVPLVVPTAALAGVEGAAFGYEGDTQADKLKNAAITAGISMAVPVGWAGIKQGYTQIAKNRTAQQLGEGEDFVSLMFTEHGLAPVYRYVVSKAYGGVTLMEQYARSIVGKALTPAAAKATAQQFRASAAVATENAKKALKLKGDNKLDAKTLDLDNKIAKAKEEAASASNAERWRHEEQIALYEKAKVDAGAAKVVAVKDADEAVSAAQASFRGQALRDAAPPGASADEINALGALDPHDANVALDDLWRQYGFKVGQDNQYSVDLKGAVNYVKMLARQYPELSLVGGEKGNIISSIERYVSQVLKEKPQGMSGKELLQIGSDIGRAIGALSDNAPSARRFATEMQDYFHEIFESGLTKAEREAFQADRYAWSVRRLVDDSIGGSSGSSGAMGNFTAADWLAAVKGYSQRLAARGGGRLQKEAEAVHVAAEKNKQNIIDLANTEAKQIMDDAVSSRRQSLKSMLKAKERITKEKNREVARLKKEQTKAKRKSREWVAKQEMIEDAKRRFDEQLADLDGNVMRARGEIEALKDLMPSTFDASVFERLFNTAILGQVLKPATGTEKIGSTLITGMAGANIMAREATQRFLAGQTEFQALMRGAAEASGGRASSAVASTTGGQAAAVAQATTEQGTVLSAQEKERILALPKRARSSVLKVLEETGRLNRLKAEDPQFYRAMKAASR